MLPTLKPKPLHKLRIGSGAACALALCLVTLFLTSTLETAHADSWPLDGMDGPQFNHFNGLAKLGAEGKEDWTSLFVERYAAPAPTDQFGPPKSQERKAGLLGTGEDLTEPPTTADGINFNYGMSWFITTVPNPSACLFTRGTCLPKYISLNASDLDLYNRCEIDPYKAVSQLRFDGGVDLSSLLKSMESNYNDAAMQLHDAAVSVAHDNNEGHQALARADTARVKSLQSSLDAIASLAASKRSETANELLLQYKTMVPANDHEGCDKINNLQTVGLLDPRLYDSMIWARS
jgi:hypothetical protein